MPVGKRSEQARRCRAAPRHVTGEDVGRVAFGSDARYRLNRVAELLPCFTDTDAVTAVDALMVMDPCGRVPSRFRCLDLQSDAL